MAKREKTSLVSDLIDRRLKENSALVAREKEQEDREAKTKGEAEESRFFNRLGAAADFNHWCKASCWSIEEAVALCLERDPKVVTWDRIRAYEDVSPFVQEYSKILDLARRAVEYQQLYEPVLPGFFLAWAKRNDIPCPPALEQAVRAHGIEIADWKDRYDELSRQFIGVLRLLDNYGKDEVAWKRERADLTARLHTAESEAWDEFDPDSETYPKELDIAFQAWRAASNKSTAGTTPKQQIGKWLDENYRDRRELSKEARRRICTIANWRKAGGKNA